MEYKGYNGRIEIDSDSLTITHSGFTAKAAGLTTNQPRVIPLQAVSGVALNEPHGLNSGSLTLGLGGEPAPTLVGRQPDSHPNTVVFLRKDGEKFRELRDRLLTVIDLNKSLGVDQTAVAFDAPAPTRQERIAADSERAKVEHAERKQEREEAWERAKVEHAEAMSRLKAEREERGAARGQSKTEREQEREEAWERAKVEHAEAMSRLKAEREAVATAKAQSKVERKQEKVKRRQELKGRQAEVGPEVASGIFGLNMIRIYQNGYVRVSLPLMGSSAPFERLLSIEASSNVSHKSGLGRAAGAIVTGGVSLARSDKRGEVYLAIVTDRKTRVLQEQPPTGRNLTTVKRLEAAGNAVIR